MQKLDYQASWTNEMDREDLRERRNSNAREALPHESQCPICGYFDISHPDVRRILLARDPKEGGLLQMARCKCPIRKQAKEAEDQRRIAQANLPHDIIRTLDSFQGVDGTKEMQEAVDQFAGGMAPHILVLQGEYGCGKSHLIEGALRELLHRGLRVRYEVAKRYLDRLRASYEEGMRESYSELSQWYRTIGVLGLDDLGMEKGTDFAVAELTDLVDERMSYGRPTIISSNISKDEMSDRLGSRLASRVYASNDDLGSVKVVYCGAGDYRARLG